MEDSQEALPVRRGMGRWVILAVIGIPCFAAAVIAVVAAGYGVELGRAQADPSRLAPEESSLQQPRSDVVGDLGGKTLRVPRWWVAAVEYDEDQAAGEKRSAPTRPWKVRRLVMEIDVPEGDASRMEFIRVNARSRDPIAVELKAGSRYEGPDALSASALLIGKPGSAVLEHHRMLPMAAYGMEAWLEPNEHLPTSSGPVEVYIGRSGEGVVSSYITCYRRSGDSGYCDHRFDLPGVASEVRFHYPIRRLPLARDLQTQFTRQFHVFLSS